MKTILPDRTKYPKTDRIGIYTNKFYLVNDTITNLFKTQRLPNKEKMTGQIDPLEGYYMYDLIKNNKFKNCLEIGMANGMSALYICQALKENGDGMLFSIDPFQTSQWKGMALENLKDAGLSKYSFLLEEKDIHALPKILKFCEKEAKLTKKPTEIFDFIFIDGDHRFDYTLLDFFYASLLLRIGGVIIVDDIRMPAVRDVIKYLRTNYKHFKLIGGEGKSVTSATFVKIADDKREWHFHNNF